MPAVCVADERTWTEIWGRFGGLGGIPENVLSLDRNALGEKHRRLEFGFRRRLRISSAVCLCCFSRGVPTGTGSWEYGNKDERCRSRSDCIAVLTLRLFFEMIVVMCLFSVRSHRCQVHRAHLAYRLISVLPGIVSHKPQCESASATYG